MSKRAVVLETRYYIAVQDGRFDNRTFASKRGAQSARNKLPPFDRRGTCIMSQTREVEVNLWTDEDSKAVPFQGVGEEIIAWCEGGYLIHGSAAYTRDEIRGFQHVANHIRRLSALPKGPSDADR